MHTSLTLYDEDRDIEFDISVSYEENGIDGVIDGESLCLEAIRIGLGPGRQLDVPLTPAVRRDHIERYIAGATHLIEQVPRRLAKEQGLERCVWGREPLS